MFHKNLSLFKGNIFFKKPKSCDLQLIKGSFCTKIKDFVSKRLRY